MITYKFLKANPDKKSLDQVMSLYKEHGWWNRGDTPKLYRGMIKGSHCFAVAIDDGIIVGMARAMSDRANDAYIQDVCVCCGYRGRGIAKKLIAMVSKRLRADGIRWIGLVSTGGTREFYEKSGFRMMLNAVPMLKQQ
jgi:ribosomal protein S18 acetylase RimI-like enzyme